MTAYKYDREELEGAIDTLCKRYPKTFFRDARLRQPLINNIVSDLENDGCPLAYDLLVTSVNWYKSNMTYLSRVTVGTNKIDLKGKVAGTVTGTEAYRAKVLFNAYQKKAEAKRLEDRKYLEEIQQPEVFKAPLPANQMQKLEALKQSLTQTPTLETAILKSLEKKESAFQVLNALHTNGHIPHDQIKKLDTPSRAVVADWGVTMAKVKAIVDANPGITIKAVAERLGVTSSTVDYHFRKLGLSKRRKETATAAASVRSTIFKSIDTMRREKPVFNESHKPWVSAVSAPTAPAPKPEAGVAQVLTKLDKAIVATNEILKSGHDKALQGALAVAALSVVINEAQSALDKIKKEGS